MIEIIPNWHPIFVHFAIALLIMATIFHVIAALNNSSTNYYQFENVANWNLWVGAIFAVITVIAGWFAYNSVDHDTPSHLAMTDHRNWAMGTTVLFVVLAIWSFRRAKKAIAISWLVTLPLIVAAGLLGVTGLKGGELVYRHGLGVMALPNTGAHDHAGHDHGDHPHDAATDEHGHDHSSAEGADEVQQQKSDEAAPEVGEHSHAHEGGDHHHDETKTDAIEKTIDQEASNTSDSHAHDHGDHQH